MMGSQGPHLAHAVDAHSPHREPLHVLLAPPEADVILEGEHVKDAVQDGHKEGEPQEVGVPLQQHPLQLVALPIGLRTEIPLQQRSIAWAIWEHLPRTGLARTAT